MRLLGVRWHRSCDAVIVFRMWMATQYAIEITRGLNFRERQLMAQDKDFSLQTCPSSEAGWHREKQRDERGKHGSGSLHTVASQIQPLQERASW